MAEMNLSIQRGIKTGTDVQGIKVPPELRVKKTSGLAWFDEAIGGEGGFTPTCTWMLTGEPGAGKSTLMRQLANSLSKAGHLVLLNSGEESPYQVKMACERLKLEQHFGVGEEVMLPRLLTHLDNMRSENPGRQMFFLQDSLQCLDDGKYVDARGNSRGTTGKTPLYCAEMIVSWMQQNFGIAMFIGQVGKGGEFLGANGIKHAIDGHMHLWYDQKEKSDTYGCLLAEVQKNRWGCTGKTLILGMEKTGLVERGSFFKPGASAPSKEE